MAQFLIRQRIDLDKDNPVMPYASALEYGGKNGHLWDAGIYQDDKPFDLSGHSVMGYFKRHDGNVVAVEGVCVGNSAQVVLDEKCYAVPGRMDCLMMITKGSATVGVAALQARVGSNLIGKMIDPGQLLPDNVSDLFSAIAAMNEATSKLNGALAAVRPWENVSASAESVAYGVQASATLSIVNGAVKFLFRVPKGKDGIDGRSFAINGICPTLEELKAAHPAGSPGDAYIIGTPEKNTVYIWDADKSSWQDVGPLEGPPGKDAELKPMPAQTIRGNATEKEALPQDLTKAQVWGILGDAPNAENLGGKSFEYIFPSRTWFERDLGNGNPNISWMVFIGEKAGGWVHLNFRFTISEDVPGGGTVLFSLPQELWPANANLVVGNNAPTQTYAKHPMIQIMSSGNVIVPNPAHPLSKNQTSIFNTMYRAAQI